MIKKIKESWYLYFTGMLLVMQAAVFLIFRENSYIQVHDNMDLFLSHYQMIINNNAFFAKNVDMPMLHGISRDLLGSEFLVANFLYFILPGFWAYIAGYGLKIAIGLFGFTLLAKEIYGDRYSSFRPVIVLAGFAYSLIPVFPTYGIAFTSVPLIAWLLIKLYGEENFKKRIVLYVGVFAYPLLSYFSYHGFFILCYMVVAFIILWVRDRRFPKTMMASLVILSAGYITWEYRLFKQMLLDDTVTIRTTMDHGDMSLGQSLVTAASEFFKASFHSQDSHNILVIWVVLVGFAVISMSYIRKHEAKKIWTDPVTLLMGWMIFNVLIFGLYQFEPFRRLVETIVPKLTGFEFARTSFFNPFLWYATLAVVLIRMYETEKAWFKRIASSIAVLAVVIVMFVPQPYNDFYYTCYNQAYKLLKNRETSSVNYREFYSTELFEAVKEEIGYEGEWSAAYGMHPGILQYNGIATVDGYLGMYSQDYKEQWLEVIAPIKDNSPELYSYYESWGARAYLFSGNDENTYEPARIMELSDDSFAENTEALKALECKYIFSRIKFSNSEEKGLELIRTVDGHNSPYVIYVYLIQ